MVVMRGGFMQIQVHTDNNITGREDVVSLVQSTVEGAVGRFGARITRVEAATIEIAVTEAADKLQRAIESKIGRIQDR
jgi:hypothetical protein